jgi:uncharacterized phage protein gp47/JayE
MALSVIQLLTPISRAQALDTLLQQLDALGFSASSWQSGGKRRAIVEMGAVVWADMSLTVKTLTEAVFLSKASGALLSHFAKSHYSLDRVEAVATRGTVVLTAAPTAGPYVITAGQLVVADAVNGYTYRNVAGGTLSLGSALSLTFEAEVAGESRNLGINSLSVLQTPLAGVTANNPGTGSPAQWITTNGADEESDASLRQRCTSRWAELSIEKPADGYIGLALGVSGVTRVEVDANNPGGEGTVDVWCAGTTATVGGATLALVQAALDAKRAVSAIVTALPALEQIVNVSAVVHVESAKNTAAFLTACQAAVAGYINGLPIGGQQFGSGFGYVDRESIAAALKGVDGAKAVSVSAPAADVAVGSHTIATVGTVTISTVSV